MITEEYRAMNAQMHRDMPHYGANGHKWGPYVLALVKKYSVESVLDYGCGKGGLKEFLRRYTAAGVQNYDPAVPEFAFDAQPADLVVCTDVMEHVEKPYTLDIVRTISELAKKAAFFNISTREAVKHLPDGRNAHINLRAPVEWFELVGEFMDVVAYEVQPGHSVTIVAIPKERE